MLRQVVAGTIRPVQQPRRGFFSPSLEVDARCRDRPSAKLGSHNPGTDRLNARGTVHSVGDGGRFPSPETVDMEDHETRRKIIRQWMALPKDKRQTAEQAAAFAELVVEQNELQSSRRDPDQRVIGWLLPRVGRE